MKQQHSDHKNLKLAMVALTLVLAMGLFVGLNVKPVYGLPAEITITATSNDTACGTVTGEGVFAPDAPVALDAVPQEGCRFINWTEGGSEVSTDSTLSFAAAVDRTLVANFAPIDRPVITAGASKGYDSAKIVWSKVDGAASYDIFRSDSPTGPYSVIDNTTALSYTQTGLTTGKTYYYSVVAVCQANITVTQSTPSASKALTPIPSTPVASAASASYTSVKVSWAGIPGATGYKVYRATSSTGSYSYQGSTTGLYYKNTGLTTGKTYYYKVFAYHTEGTANIKSKASAAVSAKPIPATPAISTIRTKTSTSSKIYWGAVSGATKYQLFRATSSGGDYTYIGAVSSGTLSYIDTGLGIGKTYYYKVRAYHLEGTTRVYSKASPIKSITIGDKYYSGVYKVGRDIPATEYYVKGSNELADAWISTDAAGEDVIGGSAAYPNCYVTLKTGQYVTFEDAVVYPLGKAPLAPKDANGHLIAAQYKVGRDIPAGEYVLLPDKTEDSVLFVVYPDSTMTSDFVGLDSEQVMTYATVKDGQYLDVYYCKAGYNILDADAPVADNTSGILTNGMYKVGRDLDAGTYTVEATSKEDSAYLVVNNSTHPISDFISLSNKIFTGTKQVTVNDGQYIYLEECKLYLSVVQ